MTMMTMMIQRSMTLRVEVKRKRIKSSFGASWTTTDMDSDGTTLIRVRSASRVHGQV